jgi:hypothetical protein
MSEIRYDEKNQDQITESIVPLTDEQLDEVSGAGIQPLYGVVDLTGGNRR